MKIPNIIPTCFIAFLTLFLGSTLLAVAQTSALRANGKIAFTSDRDGNPEIYVMNADGTNQVRLTNNSVVDDHATWSPDGTKLAFLSRRASGEYAIFQMNGDGTGKTEITQVNYQPPYNLGWDYWSISWSPDGHQITFQDRPATGQPGIYIVNADGSSRRFLTTGIQPAWSPDGSKILFSNQPVFFYWWLFTIRPDGTDLHALPGAAPYVDTAATWSPSGDRIVFQGWDWANFEDLVVANSDGTNRQDFSYGCDEGNNHLCGGLNFPDWSPDGSKIVFCWDAYAYNVDPEIWVKNVTGDGLTQLTNTTGNNVNPSWQSLASAACANANPIDCADFFVRQQYGDFLSREAEPEGLQFYLDILNGCYPDDSECIRYTRGALAANFFRSPEFQAKGTYVMYAYMVTLGQRAVTAAELQDQSKIERPHYAEFMADMSAISSPDDRNGPDPTKKAALTQAFVQRPEVVAKYPTATYPTMVSFGNALAATAGVTLSSQTQNLIAAATTRAQVLQIVAESAEVNDKFYKTAFVTMEYFGYLRRDPEDCHDPANWWGTGDPNACGYIFHNNRFNTLPLHPDLIQNFIVRGFIESPEYRQRFGP